MFAQLLAVQEVGLFEQMEQGRVIGGGRHGFAARRHLKTGALGQFFDRLTEWQVIVFHEKSDRGAMGAAAEAMIELLIRADGEGWGFFVVEGAAGLIILAGLAKLDAGADQIDNVGPRQQVVDEFGRNSDQAMPEKAVWVPCGLVKSKQRWQTARLSRRVAA